MTSALPDPTLAELAAQIGLNDLTPVDTPPAQTEPGPLALEDYFEPDPAPETFTTQPAFYNTGVSKAALVGGVSLVLFLGGASIFKVASPKGHTTALLPETTPDEAPEDPTLVALRQSQIAESKAKAKLALLAQDKAALGDEGEAVNPKAAKTTPPTTVKPFAQTKPSPIVPPAPPPPARLNPAPTYSTVTPKPKPTPVTPLPPPPNSGWTQPVQAPLLTVGRRTEAPKSVDPMAEWQRLASLGTYGEVVPSEAPTGHASGVDANAKLAALFPEDGVIETISVDEPSSSFGTTSHGAPLSDYFEQQMSPVAQPVAHWETVPPSGETVKPSGETVKPLGDSREAVTTVATAEVSDPLTTEEPEAFPEPVKAFDKPPLLAQAPDRTILVGSSGQGHLVTPVLWAPDGSRGEARFIVALSEPITDAQGEPALPDGTQFVVAAQNLDPDSGLVDLTVMALVIDGQEYEAPEGVFSVRDRQGGLLLGELRHQPNPGRGDLARVATGALTQVGALMNRPRSTSTSSSQGSFGSSQSSTVRNDDPNYVGAVLEGGFNELASVIEDRQQAAAEALAQAPQLYQLPADYPIRIFINQSLSL